jgi:F-type H+-transporting ATPase subunit epsilon
MSLNVRVITPDKVVWDAMAEELILPSSTGQLGILTDHAPLLTALDIGVMRLKSDAGWTSIVLMEGFAEVEDNKVTILCNGAEEGSTIELKTAQEELEKVTLLSSTSAKPSIKTIDIHPASDFRRITPISIAVKSGA